MSYVLISESTLEPLSITAARQHLKMDGIDDDDDLITALISSARQTVEKHTGLDLVCRTYDLVLDGFPTGNLPLAKAPTAQVSSVKYIDPNGDEQTLATSVYGVNTGSDGPFLYLKYNQSWPSVRLQYAAVTVRFITGYTGALESPQTNEAVPAGLMAAIKIILRDLYDSRGTADKPSAGAPGSTAWNLLAPFRRMGC